MGISLSVLSGIGQGLTAGADSFMRTQSMLEQQAIAKRLANAQSVDAYSKLWGVGGKQAADAQAKNLGLMQQPVDQSQVSAPPAQAPSPGMLPPQPSQPSPQSPQQPSGMLTPDVNTPDKPAQVSPSDFQNMGQSGREYYMKYQSPEAQVALQKSQADLKNANLEQFNKGNESFKSTKETFETAADAYGKLMKVTGDNSPKNLQSALMQVIKLDMPRQAVRMGSLQAMQEDPQIMQKYGNQISEITSGVPTKLTVQDLQRVGTNLYQSNSSEFRAAQKDEMANAKVRSAQPTYVNSSYADQMDKLAMTTKRGLPAYQAPSPIDAIAQLNPGSKPGLMKGIQQGAQGLISAGNRISNALVPSSTMSEPSPGSIPKISAADRVLFQKELAKNPTGPRSDMLKKLLGSP